MVALPYTFKIPRIGGGHLYILKQVNLFLFNNWVSPHIVGPLMSDLVLSLSFGFAKLDSFVQV